VECFFIHFKDEGQNLKKLCLQSNTLSHPSSLILETQAMVWYCLESI
jgi:hypothetical protein